MTKKILLMLFCFTGLSAFAQSASNNKLDTFETVIIGSLKDFPNDSMITVMEPYTGDWDSTLVKNHQFEVKLPMKKGGSMYIVQMGSSKDADYVLSKGLAMVTYLDSGKMSIVGNNFVDAKYTGSPWVNEWSEVSKLTSLRNPDFKAFEYAKKKYFEAKMIGDEEAMDKYGNEGGVLDAKLKSSYLNWIKQHSNSRVCGYLLTCYFNTNIKQMDSIYNLFSEHAKQSRIIRRWKQPGIIDPSPMSVKFDSTGNTNIPGRPNVGSIAPNIEAKNRDGKTIKLSDFKGKYVLIDFWASWCSPCIAMVPSLKATYNKFKSDKFEILGVSLDTKKEGWTKSINKEGLNWVNVSNLKGWGEPASSVFGVRAIPSNVLIDPDGNIIAYNLFKEELDKKLSELLK